MACRVADIPARDRPRERLDRLGAGALTEAELVALVIRSGGRDWSAIEIAHDMIAAHGSLQELASAELSDLKRCSTMGSAKASALIAAFELGRRAGASAPSISPRIKCSRDVAAVAAREIDDPQREQTLVLILSALGATSWEIISAADAVNVRFLDHVIIAGSRWTSIRERAQL